VQAAMVGITGSLTHSPYSSNSTPPPTRFLGTAYSRDLSPDFRG
jgi:hypothetical protein